MLVLALDTTTRGGSVAVACDDTVLALVEGDDTRTHGERLPGEIAAALAQARVDRREIDLLAVASGPGAFTGLRIGLAAVQGLAMALGKLVVGISALEALADTVWTGRRSTERVVTWMDAQRGEVFSAVFAGHDPRPLSDPMVGPPDVALAAVPFSNDAGVVFAGDGALRYADFIAANWRGPAAVLDAVPALAPAIARLGRRDAAAGLAGPPHALRPLYVRRPDAERDRERQARS